MRMLQRRCCHTLQSWTPCRGQVWGADVHKESVSWWTSRPAQEKKKLSAVRRCHFTKAECTLLPSYMCTVPCNSIVSTIELSGIDRPVRKGRRQGRHTLSIYVQTRWLPRPINGSVVLTQDKAQFSASFVPFPFRASSRDDHWASRERQRGNVEVPRIYLRSFSQRENGEIKCCEWCLLRI